MPEPPARLSMTTVWFHASPSLVPTARATMSLAPPVANGTTKRTGFAGTVCAMALEPATAASTAIKCTAQIGLSESAIRQILHDGIQLGLRLEADARHIR